MKPPHENYTHTEAPVSGIWQNPILVGRGSATLSMYQAVAKFLSLHGAPAVIDCDCLVFQKPIRIAQSPDGKQFPITIYAQHAYYSVPLGEGARSARSLAQRHPYRTPSSPASDQSKLLQL